MSNDYSLYNLLANLSMEGSCLGIQMSKDEFMEKYKGSNKESVMEKIFSVLDKADKNQDGAIDLNKHDGDGMLTWRTRMSVSLFQAVMSEGKNYPKGFILNEEKFFKQFKEGITVDDFREALQNMDTIIAKHEIANDQKEFADLKFKHNDIPDVVLKSIRHNLLDTDFKIKKTNQLNPVLYEVKSKNEEDDSERITIIDENGNVLSQTRKYMSRLQTDEYGEINTDILYVLDENNPIAGIFQYTSGLKRTLFKNGSENIEYQKTQFNIDDEGKLNNIIVNKGLPTETKLKVTMNDYNIEDIAISTDSSVLKLPNETKRLFANLYNNELTFGVDYTLEVKCNEICVKVIKPDNMSDNAKNEVDRLVKNGCFKGVDYRITDLGEGNYAMEYLSNKSRDFESDTKKAIYSSDGKVEIIATNKDDNSFNVPDEFKENLCKIGEKKYISESSYAQKINNDSYRVTIHADKISVKKNKKEFFINTQGMSHGLVKLVSECNPIALYRIASYGILLKFEKPETEGDGEYIPDENIIYIDSEPDVSSLYTIQRRIAHETGHSYYTHKNPVNKELEESFKKESELYQAKVDEIKASVPKEKNYLETLAKQFEALEKWDKYSPEGSDERYCATNVYEFVAEAYCLYVSGDAKSAFTLINVYPETFQLFKQMIENEPN